MPSSKSKKLLRGTITYAIGDFGTKILSFLIVPLYTYFISTHDMGVYDLLISTSGLLLPIITLQISDAAYRWMISGEKDPKSCIKASYDVIFINCIIVATSVYVINAFIKIPYCNYFVILLLVSAWYTTILKLIRGLHHQKLYAGIGVLFTAINVFLNLFQVVVLNRGVISLFISAIGAYSICIIVSVILEKNLRKITIRENTFEVSKRFIRFSAPLIPNYLNWWLINSSDSYIVTYFLGASSNGILAVSHKFPAVLQTFFGLFNTAWQDLAISDRNQDKNFYSEVFAAISSMMLGILLVIAPLTKIFIYLIMNIDYKTAADYIPLYYLGAVYQGFSSFYGVGYLKNNNTSRAFITSIYAAVINLVVDFLMIKFIGIHAASLSTFIGFFIMWLVRERQNRKELGIEVKWKAILLLTGLDIIISLISIRTSIFTNFVLLAVGGIVFFIMNKQYFKLLLTFVRRK